jgi:hypothetical protein
VTGWTAGERREGQVCREVYLSREVVVVVQEKGTFERDAGGVRDGPWVTQGMSMRYACKEIVGYG